MNVVSPDTTTPPVYKPPALPWAEAFFREAILGRSLSHAYILKGRDSGAMYRLVMQLVTILNCQNPWTSLAEALELPALACGTCTSCRWVAKNAHPALLTISRLTYQVTDEGGDLSPDDLEKLAKKAGQPTQIKAPQIERLLSQLALSSEYTRVIVFTDVEELPAAIPSDVIPPFEWASIEANEGKSFHIRPLERRLFNQASANRFLKTLEEPQPRTLFFFLVETEEQLLETIVSRCQVIPCQPAAGDILQGDEAPSDYRAFIDAWWAKLEQDSDVYALAGEFEAFFTEEQGLSLEQALALLQRMLRARMAEQLGDEQVFLRYRDHQMAIETAIRMLGAKTTPSAVVLNLLLSLRRSS